MGKLFSTAAAVLLLCGFASAQNFSAAAKGSTAAEFLQLGVGGREMGMGGAASAVVDDAGALYWNPAALTSVEHRSATFMHAAYLQSSFFDYGAYAQNLGRLGAFGASVQYWNAGSIQETDANFNGVGSFTPYDLAVTAGYAYKLSGGPAFLEGASVGAAAEYVRTVVLNSAQTEAVDFGFLSPEYLDRRLRLALTAANIGGALNDGAASENLPMTFKAGGSFRLTDRWLAALDVAAPRGSAPYFAAGTEYVLPIQDVWSLACRAGYGSQTLGGVTGVSGVSIGLGFGSKSLDFDYAFVPYGGLGITNRFSVSAKF